MNVGLYFGSFNPVHIGHMIIAQYVLEHTDLEEVWFVVSPHNPLKDKKSLLNERQRLHMVNLAIGDELNMRATDIEFGLPQPSYTIHTLLHLKEKFPGKKFFLIMGADSLATFHKWKNYERILDEAEIIVYPRPGTTHSGLENHPHIHRVNAPLIEISATEIRNDIREGRNVSFMLPHAVWSYIKSCGFYEN